MAKKPADEELGQKDQLAHTPWRMYLLICIVGLMISGILGYGFFKGDRMVKVYAPLVDAAMEIKLEATTAHLWFEEIISGDHTEDISEVWKHQDQAEWYANAMLEGGKNLEGTFIPLDDAEMRRKIKNVQEKLKEYRGITQKRLETRDLSGIGTDIDQRYDHVFRSFLKEADKVETKLQQIMAKDLNSFRYTQVLLIVISILLFVAIGIFFWHFDNQRIKHLLWLNEANRALQKSEENLSVTLNSIGDAVIATDSEGRIVRMNPVAEKLTGWNLLEAKGIPLNEVFNIINEETRHTVENPVERVLREGIIVGLANHTVLISKDGTEYAIEDSGAPIQDDDGNISGVVLTFVNSTEKRVGEKALRESNERYSNIFKAADEAIFIIDYDGVIIDANPRASEMYGYSPDEFKNLPAKKLIRPDDHHIFVEHIKILEKTNKFYSEHRNVRKDGSIINVAVSATTISISNKEFLVSIVSDITKRKKAEDALRESEEFLREIIENIPNMIFVKDAEELRFVRFNKAGEALTGYSREDLLGKNDYDIFPKEEADYFTRKDREAINNTKLLEISEEPIQTKYKDERILHTQKIPICDEEGKPKYLLGISEDITERKQMEEKHKILESQLQQAQEMESIGTLAGGIAHDFNNILSPIMIHSELLQMDLPKDSSLQDNLEQIFQASFRARDLVKQILTFSRQNEKQPASINITPVVKEVVKLLRSTLPATIDIRYELPDQCGSIMADPTQIHQVLMNLCTNASHAMGTEGGVLEIKLTDISLVEDDGIPELLSGRNLKLTVSDTGLGMEPAVIDRIFEPFFTTKAPTGGTGMGLAVTHGIVKSLGGSITVESNPGQGTTFHIFFPVIRHGVKEKINLAGETPSGTERILVVDDEEPIATTLMQMLERLGYQVETRTSGIEALEKFRSKPDEFDLVITDQTMPNMTGDKLTQRLLEIRSDIPIILCTGFSERINEENAAEAGIKAFVMKPIVMHEIANTIRKVLDDK